MSIGRSFPGLRGRFRIYPCFYAVEVSFSRPYNLLQCDTVVESRQAVADMRFGPSLPSFSARPSFCCLASICTFAA